MELQVDCCANAEEAHTFMHSDAFAANRIGVEFDPDALLMQYRNGVPAATLLVQPGRTTLSNIDRAWLIVSTEGR